MNVEFKPVLRIPRGYRIVRSFEILKKGDLFYSPYTRYVEWEKVQVYIGSLKNIFAPDVIVIRRKLK